MMNMQKKILQNTAVRCANQFNFSEFSSVNFIPCSSLRDCKLITNRSIAAIFPGRLFLVVDSSTLKKIIMNAKKKKKEIRNNIETRVDEFVDECNSLRC